MLRNFAGNFLPAWTHDKVILLDENNWRDEIVDTRWGRTYCNTIVSDRRHPLHLYLRAQIAWTFPLPRSYPEHKPTFDLIWR